MCVSSESMLLIICYAIYIAIVAWHVVNFLSIGNIMGLILSPNLFLCTTLIVWVMGTPWPKNRGNSLLDKDCSIKGSVDFGPNKYSGYRLLSTAPEIWIIWQVRVIKGKLVRTLTLRIFLHDIDHKVFECHIRHPQGVQSLDEHRKYFSYSLNIMEILFILKDNWLI